MIKRLSFADRAPGVAAATFADAWTRAWTAASAAVPTALRAERVVVCTTVPEVGGPPARHDGVVIEWFADADHLAAHDARRTSRDPSASDGGAVQLMVAGAPVVVEEVVLRGADWLAQRWVGGEPRFKHMALAQRVDHLGAQAFSDRWRNHAGQVAAASADGGPSPATGIPDDVRGRAYVQNHPLPRSDGDWAYDAVNEVYFDDLAGLARRIRWFEDNRVGAQPDELFGASWFLAVRETVLFDRT